MATSQCKCCWGNLDTSHADQTITIPKAMFEDHGYYFHTPLRHHLQNLGNDFEVCNVLLIFLGVFRKLF